MADYIDRNAAIEALRKLAEYCPGSTEAATAAAMAISVISRVPSPWVSVKDRPPDEEDDVLILLRTIERYGKHQEKRYVFRSPYVGYRVDDEWYTFYCYGYQRVDDAVAEIRNEEISVTHWMLLPDAPGEEAKHEEK